MSYFTRLKFPFFRRETTTRIPLAYSAPFFSPHPTLSRSSNFTPRRGRTLCVLPFIFESRETRPRCLLLINHLVTVLCARARASRTLCGRAHRTGSWIFLPWAKNFGARAECVRVKQEDGRPTVRNVRKLTDETSLKVSTWRSFEVQNFVIKVTKSRDCRDTVTQMERERNGTSLCFVWMLEDKSMYVVLDG